MDSDEPTGDSAEEESSAGGPGGTGDDEMELDDAASSADDRLSGGDDEGRAEGEGEDGNEEEEESSDSDDDEEEEESSSSSDDDESGEEGGQSAYERLREERIARNKARLKELGFDDDAKKKKAPTRQRQRKSLPDGPRRQLPGRAKRATFHEAERGTTARKRREEPEEKKNTDACWTCQKVEGEMRVCDYCRMLYHPDCHDPPISPTNDDFKCSECEAAGRSRRVACGKCAGCLREDDCMTCAACVNTYGTGKTRQKCIFRKCQSWGKTTLVRANTGDDTNVGEEEGEEEEEDNHDSNCFVCDEGGDVICCDGCTKVYHAACHKPKIYDLPDGDWFCMECAPTKKAAAPWKKKKKYEGPLVADLGHCEVACTVRFPRIECVYCEEGEVTGKNKPLDWVTCRACDDSYHMGCLDPPLESRPNSWRCPTCKERKIKAKKKEEKETMPLFEGEHDDDCFMCGNGGDLLCCDYCSKAYHLPCHIPPVAEIPTGLWKCQECAALGYKRLMKCGTCEACTRDDCGTCTACIDKPKFGGLGRLKQACERKNCPFKRFAPPAKATPKVSKKKKEEMKLQFAGGDKKRKRDRTGNPESDERGGKEEQKAVQDPGVGRKKKKQKDTIDAVAWILNSKPLKNDPVGNKMRQIIIRALKRPEESKVQDKALEHLRGLVAGSAENASKVILLGGLTMTSKAMKDHFDKSVVQAEACALLAEIIWENPSFIPAILEEGFLGLVLSSMRYHGSQPKVQQMGCGVFRALSYVYEFHETIYRVNALGAIIDVMRASAKKFDILKEGSYFLQNITCNPEITVEAIDLILSKGTVLIVVDALAAASPLDTEFVEAACGVLANLAINETAREQIGSYESSIPSLLKFVGSSASATNCSLLALKLLAMGNDENKAKMVGTGGVKAVVELLASITDLDEIDAAVKLLEELAAHKDGAQKLVDAGGIEFVASVMGKHSALPSVQASCLGILRHLPVSDAEDQANSTSGLVLSAMKSHKVDRAVQFAGCHVLLRHCSQFPTFAESLNSKGVFPLSSDVRSSRRKRSRASKPPPVAKPSDEIAPDASQALARAPIDTAGGDVSREIAAILTRKPLKDDPTGNKMRLIIVKAIKEAGNHKIQDKALEHLRCMATTAENASKIVDLGGLTMAAKAMADHPAKTVVQAEASAFLAELSWVNPSCVPAIAKEGCLRQVLGSMESHATNKKVQQMGCGLFRAMSYDFANHSFINAANGVGAIIDAMKINSTQYLVLKEACYFLQNVLCNPAILPETIQLVASSGMIELVVDSISEKPNADEFVTAACGVLANLAIDDGARESILQYGSTIPTLLAVLGSGADVDACKCALNALKLLATRNIEAKAKIADLGGIQTVMDSLSSGGNDVVLLDSGLGFLAELAKGNEGNAQSLLDAGGLELVTKEMENHAESPHVQARACEILGNLPVGSDSVEKVIKLILEAMTNHAPDGAIQYDGTHALVQLCCQYPDVVGPLLSKDAAILSGSRFM
ncbi:hypothetical protein ACHAXT_000862 [Thalassiosira profunda]